MLQEEQEKKRLQQLQKKEEAKVLLEKELSSIKIGGKQPAAKVTRAEIVSVTEKRNQVALKKKEDEKPLEENLNRIVIEGETAHGIDEAISVLRYEPSFVWRRYFILICVNKYLVVSELILTF